MRTAPDGTLRDWSGIALPGGIELECGPAGLRLARPLDDPDLSAQLVGEEPFKVRPGDFWRCKERGVDRRFGN
jgi:hypothetical protein